MTDNLIKNGDGHSPSQVCFAYKEGQAVPVFAKHKLGTPFTGDASGSFGVVDWTGPFLDGRPHGDFKINWGDRAGGWHKFQHGNNLAEIEIVLPDAGA